MKLSNFKIFTVLLIVLTFGTFIFYSSAQNTATPAVVAPIKITSSIDSASITMGERTTLHVEILKNGHEGAILVPVQEGKDEKSVNSIAGIEIRQIDVDSTDLGNNRIQVNYDILLQPFEPEAYTIPPFKYAIDGDTFTSNPVALKVLEPEMPEVMRDSLYINPLRPPMELEAEWYDWIPEWLSDYWYWWLAGLLVLLLLATILILYKKNGKGLLPSRKIVPPYQLAMRRLNELKRKRLHEKGHNKAYYTELTDILRQYLGGRFKIYALEMTSSQILDELERNPETAPFADELRPMFRIADFVKFAKQESTTDENIRSFNAVENFVNDTRPVEQETKPKASKSKA